jgi:hypothetical protein
MRGEEGMAGSMMKQSIRLSAFTPETQRVRRDELFVCPENCSGQTKSFCLE